MSVIFKYKFENKYFHLKKTIDNLELINDSLTFKMTIYNIIKLLSSISKSIKNNLFGKHIVTELLLNIISYLPHKYVSIFELVCTNWKQHINSNISKKILPQLKQISYLKV